MDRSDRENGNRLVPIIMLHALWVVAGVACGWSWYLDARDPRRILSFSTFGLSLQKDAFEVYLIWFAGGAAAVGALACFLLIAQPARGRRRVIVVVGLPLNLLALGVAALMLLFKELSKMA